MPVLAFFLIPSFFSYLMLAVLPPPPAHQVGQIDNAGDIQGASWGASVASEGGKFGHSGTAEPDLTGPMGRFAAAARREPAPATDYLRRQRPTAT